MRFWDSSALVPLLTKEETTDDYEDLYRADRDLLISFTTPVELTSAIWRKSGVNDDLRARAERRYLVLESNWTIVDDYESVLEEALDVIPRYRLRAGDAMQLACAIVGRRTTPGLEFVTDDGALIYAARAEGFEVRTEFPRDNPR